MNLIYTLNKSPAFIFDYLTDMVKFASIHPVITRIDKTGESTYLVHETLKLGFIHYSFTYPVTLMSNEKDHTVSIKATVMKVTIIEMNYSIREENGISTVDELITIKSPLPLKSYMEKIFREQHALFFQQMEQL